MAQLVRTPAAALQQHFQANIAVVIGINDYEHVRGLKTAQADAAYLATLLRDDRQRRDKLDRYKLFERYDKEATADAIHELLTTLLPAEVKAAGPHARVIFYFAGHGDAEYTDNTIKGYLFPQDAQPREPDESRRRLLPMAEVQTRLAELDCQHVLIILDCCSAGAMARESTTRSALLPPPLYWETLQRYVGRKARQVITSAAHNQKASDVAPGYNVGERDLDKNAAHSPFALALFEALAADPLHDGRDLRGAGRDGVVTATELYLSISDSLYRQVGDSQTPGLWTFSQGHEAGDYVFLLPGAEVKKLESAPDLTKAEYDPWPRTGDQGLAQAELFAGRDEETRALARLIDARPLAAVTGSSAVGKTSLVRAGLLPWLHAGNGTSADGKSKAWRVLPPLRLAVPTPLPAVITHVSQAVGSATQGAADQGAGDLRNLAAAWARDHPGQRLLLAVDAPEALFEDADEAAHAQLWTALAEAAQQDILHVIVTLRSDHWHVRSETAGEDKRIVLPTAERFELGLMNLVALHQVIERPSAARMIEFESDALVDRLARDVDGQPAALPLLTETLHRMYDCYAKGVKDEGRFNNRTLSQADYGAVRGVEGVIADLAQGLYGQLPDDDHRRSMQHVLMRLVKVEDGQYVRRKARQADFEFPDGQAARRAGDIIAALAACGLVVQGADAAGEPFVELGHSGLVTAWPQMQKWLVEQGAEWALQRDLAARVEEWQLQKPKTLLWKDDPRLPQVEATLWPAAGSEPGLWGRLRWEWRVLFPPKNEAPAAAAWTNRDELAFVRASVSERSGFRQRLFKAVTAFVAIVLIFGGLAIWQWRVAETRRAEAEMEARRARAGELTSTALQVFSASPLLAMLLGVEGLRAQSTFSETVTGAAQANMHDLLNQPIGVPLTDHTAAISVVTYSSDGHWLVTGSDDGMARLWDRWNLHADPTVLPSRQGSVVAAVFSRDSGWLALGSSDDPQDAQRTLSAGLVVRSQDDAVTVAAATPDRRILVRGRVGLQIQLWDLHTREPRQIDLGGLDHDANTMNFSSDGRWLASGGRDATIRLWDLNNLDADPIELIGTGGQVLDLSFNATANELLAVACGDETTVQLWNPVHPDTAPRVVAVARQPCTMAEFSTDGRWLATVDAATAWLWDLQNTETSPVTLDGHSSNILTLNFSLDGNWLGTGSWDTTVRLWDTQHIEKGSVVLAKHIGQVSDVQFSPDGQRLASASYDRTVMLWDIGNPQASPTVLHGHEASVYAVTFDPRGTALATGSADGTARLWDLRNLSRDPYLLHGEDGKVGWVDHIAYSSSGRWLATGSWDGNVQLWEIGDRRVLRRTHLSHNGHVTDIAFSRDESRLATGGWDGTVALWDLHNLGNDPEVLSNRGGSVLNIEFSPDGNWLAISSTDANVRLRNLHNLQENPIVLTGHQGEVWGLAFSPEGNWLASGSRDNTVRLWEMKDSHFNAVFEQEYEGWVDKVVFSSDGHFLVGSNKDRTVRLLDVSNRPSTITLPTELEGGAWAPTFSHNSRYLAVGSSGKVQLWDLQHLESGSVITLGHSGTELAFSPDDRLLASGGADYVYVWDISNVQAGANTIVYRSSSVITDLEFSPNGCCLAAAGLSAFVRMWTLGVDDLADLACESSGRNLSYEEWQRYFFSEPSYRRTCFQWPTHPSVTEALTAEAKVLAFEGDLKSAADRLRQAKNLEPRLQFDPETQARHLASDAYADRCFARYKAEDIQGAIEDCTSAIKFNSNSAWAYEARGYANDALGSYDLAIEDYSTVIALGVAGYDLTNAYANRGWVYYETERYEKAVDDLLITISLDPKYVWAYDFLGRSYSNLGHHAEAVQNLTQAIELGSHDYEYYTWTLQSRSKSYFAMRQDELALADLRTATTEDPGFTLAWNYLCWYGTLAGTANQVLDACETAVKLAPDDGDIRDSRGLARALTGDVQGAIDDFEFALAQVKANGWSPYQIATRTTWIEALRAGQNPFDAGMLERLRHE